MIADYPGVRQTSEHSCGLAAYNGLARYNGRPERGPESVNRVQGLAPDTLKAYALCDYPCVASGQLTVGLLRGFTREAKPVLCPVSLYGGHWVTVTGVKGQRVFFFDPASGERSLTIREWLAVWSDRSESGHEYTTWGLSAWTSSPAGPSRP